MGRRSINTTKSGKYMNPTDQARKEARKKELKKNKKQRQMVRAAVLKGKNPAQLIEEMEKIDEMGKWYSIGLNASATEFLLLIFPIEYNVLQPSPLNEKVLREKRKKLKETFDRVMRLYVSSSLSAFIEPINSFATIYLLQNNDDPEMWADLKRREVEYEKRKSKRIQYYESVRTAQSVQIEDIPLPDASGNSDQSSKPALPFPPPKMPADFQPQMAPPNMRPPMSTLPPGLSSRSSLDATAESADTNKPKEDPGVPPFVPPNLLNMRELDSDYESEGDADSGEKESAHNSTEQSSSESDEGRKSDHSEDSTLPKPTSVQQRILAIAGQKYDDFMKELENVHKKKNDQERSRADERASAQSDADKETDRGSRNNFVDNRKGDEPHPLSGPDSNHSVPPPMPRRDNPVMIPNNAAFPAPPMAPPPFTSKMPGLPPPPPPPMGKLYFPFCLSVNFHFIHRVFQCLF